MKKSKLYTRTGDGGTTSLVSGTRVHKSDLRIDIYGDLDELNSLVGYALSAENAKFNSIKEVLTEVQKHLFVMGSNIACEAEKRVEYKLPVLGIDSVELLEKAIDSLDTQLPTLKSFILPSGSEFSCRLHLCRTYARNLERKAADFDKNHEDIPGNYLIFLNRLSDYLFVTARYVNAKLEVQEVNWP
jgi:cob(I)alamin adenosyltransferase